MRTALLLALLLATGCASAQPTAPDRAASAPAAAEVEAFPLTAVRLLPSPFHSAMERDRQYLLDLDPDRLLAPYLIEAGLEPKAPTYDNWEGDGLGGHIGGHYLSALALMVASTGDDEMRERLAYMVAELKRAQDAVGTGYLGGVPDPDGIWPEIARGDIEADLFELNDRWVPWYNLHKTYAGLRDAHVHGGVDEALPMLVALADWARQLTEGLTDAQMQTMLRAEYGGMNETFADVAALTGDDSYLELADRFSHRLILDPLEEREDRLTGLHANTQIPKVIGFKRLADVARQRGVGGYEDWDDAARFFWDTVVTERTVAIGGNSVREHFHPADDFSSMINEPEGPETCNTYNMLRLTKMLYESSGDAGYLDYYERALYNHILSSQHPEHGGLVYFTSMRPSHYRVYSQPDRAMWCCVGSGIENHAKYGEMVYALAGRDLFVNLFIPSTLDWDERGARLRMETQFPDAETVTITVEEPGDVALHLRQPGWTDGMRVAVNGRALAAGVDESGYVRVDRRWEAGDEIVITLPMHTRLEQMPDGSDHYAVLHGPIVLAAKTEPFPGEQLAYLADDSRMGHIASGPLCPPSAAPVFVGDTDEFLAGIEPVAGQPLTFRAPEGVRGTDEDLTLIPFFRLHDSRYVVYWPQATEAEHAADSASVSAMEMDRMALEAQTIDHVAPGEQQPEVEHGFRGEGSEAGVHRGRHWRHASGWFSYDLADPDAEAALLRVTYFGLDRDRTFDLSLDGVPVATVALDGSRGDDFYTVDYEVPAAALAEAEDGTLTVRFEAHPGSMAGGIYGVRLLRAAE